jgi:hypothetical protein
MRKFARIENADCAVLWVYSILAMPKVKYGEMTRSSSFIPHATLPVQPIFWSVLRQNFSPQKKIPINSKSQGYQLQSRVKFRELGL